MFNKLRKQLRAKEEYIVENLAKTLIEMEEKDGTD